MIKEENEHYSDASLSVCSFGYLFTFDRTGAYVSGIYGLKIRNHMKYKYYNYKHTFDSKGFCASPPFFESTFGPGL